MASKEELETLYRTLYGRGVIHSKKDLAEKLGMNPHSVQSAFSVGEPYLNDKLLKRIRDTFPELQQQPEETFSKDMVQRLLTTIESQQRTIEMLVSGRIVAAQSQAQKNLGVENYGE